MWIDYIFWLNLKAFLNFLNSLSLHLFFCHFSIFMHKMLFNEFVFGKVLLPYSLLVMRKVFVQFCKYVL